MSKTDLWRQASEAMSDDADPRWQAVGAWLRGEALVHEGMEPFVELLNAAYESTGGPSAYLRFGRHPDGEVSMFADTNEGATAVALAYLEAAAGVSS